MLVRNLLTKSLALQLRKKLTKYAIGTYLKVGNVKIPPGKVVEVNDLYKAEIDYLVSLKVLEPVPGPVSTGGIIVSLQDGRKLAKPRGKAGTTSSISPDTNAPLSVTGAYTAHHSYVLDEDFIIIYKDGQLLLNDSLKEENTDAVCEKSEETTTKEEKEDINCQTQLEENGNIPQEEAIETIDKVAIKTVDETSQKEEVSVKKSKRGRPKKKSKKEDFRGRKRKMEKQEEFIKDVTSNLEEDKAEDLKQLQISEEPFLEEEENGDN